MHLIFELLIVLLPCIGSFACNFLLTSDVDDLCSPDSCSPFAFGSKYEKPFTSQTTSASFSGSFFVFLLSSVQRDMIFFFESLSFATL